MQQDPRPVPQWLKSALDLGPALLFFVAYLWLKDEVYVFGGAEYDGFIVVTALFVPILLATILVSWKLTGQLSRMQVFTMLMVVVFGGLTVWFNDERFFKMKTTIVYAFFAGMLGLGLMLGQSWLKSLMGEVLPMKDEGWMIITRRIAIAFAAMAVANEIVWRTQSDQFWVTFETFALPAFLFIAFMSQTKVMERYSLSETSEKDAG